jgi:hypothetical protein
MYKLYPEEKKIPAPFAFLFIFLMVFALSFIFNKPRSSSVKAQKLKLERLEITNITNNSASVFWRTKEKEVSWLVYGDNETRLEKNIFDERDLANNKNSYFNHYVTFKNLEPNKKYFFIIATPKGLIKKNNNLPFSFTTKIQLPLASSLLPAMGKVLNKNGQPLADGIILLKIEGAELLSERTKDKGEWLIPFYYLVKSDSDELFQPKPDTEVSLEIISEEGETSTVKTTLKNVSPLPQTIIIGKNYVFANDEEKVLSEKTKNDSRHNKIGIIFPKENAAIPGKKPILKGVALPRKKVKVIIESTTPQIFEIYADKDGVWSLSPFYELEPGKHHLTIITEDENGKEIKISRSFNILKSGESVLGEATPSATLSPTIIPTVITYPTSSPTSSPTATITLIAQSTLTPPGPPGTNFFPLVTVGLALMFLGTGLIMVF